MLLLCVERKYELNRLLESVALPYCDKKRVSYESDMNTVYANESGGGDEVCVEELEDVKVPVKLLLVCVMHMVQGDTESRLKCLYRLFKECVLCVVVDC